MNNAAHTKLTAGTGGTIAGTEKLELQLDKTYTCTYQIGTDGKDLVLERDTNGLAGLHADAVSLTVEPKLFTITVDGNGGISDGEPTRKLQVEAGQRITLDFFGFTRPGYCCTGFNDKLIDDTSFGGDAEIKLNWFDTGFEEFLALDLNGEKVPDVTKQEHLYYDGPTGKQVLFVDYSSGKATIPTVGISNKKREILYWYTGEDGTLEGESSLQFVPGETVDETQLPKGSTLCAQAWGGYYTLYANGKTFSNGKKVVTTSSNYLPNFTASDGTVVHHYCTDPLGGEPYLPDSEVSLPRGTKLYAFWEPKGTVPFIVQDDVNGIRRLSAQAGRELTLPAPKTRPGLKLAYWECHVVCRDNSGTVERHQPSETFAIPENAFEGNISAFWTLDGPVTIDGKEIEISNEKTDQAGDGWSMWFNQWFGMVHLTLDGSGTKYALGAKLEDVKARVLYAQWETKLEAAVTETTATETVVTFTPKDGENVRIEATNENHAAVPPEQARRVILAAYRNGQFLGMLPATAETGKIICRIPKDKYGGCELKIFFLEGGKPTQEMEIVRLYN